MKKVLSVTAVCILMCVAKMQGETEKAVSMTQSDCKHNAYESPEKLIDSRSEDEDSKVVVQLRYADGRLTVEWYDIYAVCGVQLLSELKRESNNQLLFRTYENFGDGPSPDCLCNYDLESVFEDIEPGMYTMRFTGSWYFNYEYHIDLTEGCEYALTEKMSTSAVKNINCCDSAIYLDASKVMHTSGAGNYDIEIYDSRGICLAKIAARDDYEISLSTLPAGMYIVRLSTGQSAVLSK